MTLPASSSPSAGLALHELNPLAVARGWLRLHACEILTVSCFSFFILSDYCVVVWHNLRQIGFQCA